MNQTKSRNLPASTLNQFVFALVLGALGLMTTTQAQATAFESCPSKAFLIQHTSAILYGVNLATGFYSELENDLGTSGKINALGFNFHDNYLYGWGYEAGSPVRISSDFQATPLQVTGMPNTNFFVGDVAVDHNTYYVYRSGSSYGLYAIDLDSETDGVLSAERVVDGNTLKLTIFDMAFHPDNSFAYAVDRNGNLHQINATEGTSQSISNVGVTGTFGATYFDVDGYLYISRNSDGFVFRIDLNAANPVAEFYAHGPASNNNDGARCALAPIVAEDDSDIDFGDAPASYGTTLEDNGARHDIGANNVYLGQQVDGESGAFIWPLSDDTADGVDDEDGIQFISGLELGEQALITAEASASAYLNVWFDWDQSGTFDDNERAVSQRIVSQGTNYLVINTPVWATPGVTWARFRISSNSNVGPTGGVGDGEVEDYEVSVVANGVTEKTYPSSGSWATVAYEDNWPIQGDYDMNDLVAHLRIRELHKEGSIIGAEISGELVAVGGIYHNGFAVRLPGVNASTLSNDSIQYWINGRLQSASPLESNQGEIIFIIANDAWDYVSPGEGCTFYRTEVNCESAAQMNFKLRVSFGIGVDESVFPQPPYDPFLFATPGYGRVGFDEPPGRGLEIHLPGNTPTDAFNSDLLGRGDDRSDENTGEYFRTETGMPWALQLGYEWRYPREFMDITSAYPLFETFVNSSGSENTTWYLLENADAEFIYQSE